MYSAEDLRRDSPGSNDGSGDNSPATGRSSEDTPVYIPQQLASNLVDTMRTDLV